MPDLISDAEQIQKDVRKLARKARERFRRRIRTAATRWAIARFLAEQSFAHLGLLLYAVLAVVGMVYVWAFYKRFDIAILDFYETPDFLLSVASDIVVMVAGVMGVFFTLVPLAVMYGLSVTRSVYRDYHSLYQEAKDAQRARRFLALTIVGGIVALPMPVLVAWGFGTVSAETKTANPHQPVRVTLRSSAAADPAALPASGATALPEAGRTILVGTTNRYHFFYECKAAEGELPLKSCDAGGKPFIVGTDNVAAIAKLAGPRRGLRVARFARLGARPGGSGGG